MEAELAVGRNRLLDRQARQLVPERDRSIGGDQHA